MALALCDCVRVRVHVRVHVCVCILPVAPAVIRTAGRHPHLSGVLAGR